jgi:hypothetical protein
MIGVRFEQIPYPELGQSYRKISRACECTCRWLIEEHVIIRSNNDSFGCQSLLACSSQILLVKTSIPAGKEK